MRSGAAGDGGCNIPGGCDNSVSPPYPVPDCVPLSGSSDCRTDVNVGADYDPLSFGQPDTHASNAYSFLCAANPDPASHIDLDTFTHASADQDLDS